MKKIISILLLSAVALAELPPTYRTRGFRPSPQFNYGPPSRQRFPSADITIPSKLTIEQLIRLTEQFQSSRGRVVHKPQNLQGGLPQDSYLPPPRVPQQTFQSPSNRPPPSQPQIIYGTPYKPHNQYGPPQPPQGLPNKLQNHQFTSFPAQQTNFGGSHNQVVPHDSYGVPVNNQPDFGNNNNLRPPSTSYGVPDTRNIETFGEQNILSDSTRLQLPSKPASGFRNPQPSISQQYLPQQPQNPSQNFNINSGEQNILSDSARLHLPSKSASGFRNPQQQYLPASQDNALPQQPQNPPQNFNINSGSQNSGTTDVQTIKATYLPPPPTTPRSAPATSPTTPRPTNVATTPPSESGFDYDYDQQPTTEPSLNQDGSEGGPNVSISTAVAGVSPNIFYLQQPDGRLQKVVLEKTKEPNSKPEEYVANYYFQNIQALPDTAYSPLISLGSYVQP